MRPALDHQLEARGLTPSTIASESSPATVVTADVPGLKKDEIHVRLADANRRLILEGETKTFEKAEPAAAQTVKEDAAGSTAATTEGEGDVQGACESFRGAHIASLTSPLASFDVA